MSYIYIYIHLRPGAQLKMVRMGSNHWTSVRVSKFSSDSYYIELMVHVLDRMKFAGPTLNDLTYLFIS